MAEQERVYKEEWRIVSVSPEEPLRLGTQSETDRLLIVQGEQYSHSNIRLSLVRSLRAPGGCALRDEAWDVKAGKSLGWPNWRGRAEPHPNVYWEQENHKKYPRFFRELAKTTALVQYRLRMDNNEMYCLPSEMWDHIRTYLNYFKYQRN